MQREELIILQEILHDEIIDEQSDITSLANEIENDKANRGMIVTAVKAVILFYYNNH
jgi:hypothetical protein